MKLLYVADARMPTEKAHGIQIMAMCDAFQRAGAEVTLLVPARYNKLTVSPFAYYQQPETFVIDRLRILDATRHERWLGSWVFGVEKWSFARTAVRVALHRTFELSYHRDLRTFVGFVRAGLAAVWEVHDLPRVLSSRELAACAASRGIVAITQGLKARLMEMGVSAKQIHVAADGVDLRRFLTLPARDAARALLGLPMDKVLAVYAGHLYPWKGVDVLLNASKGLPSAMEVVFVGGGPRFEELKKDAQASGARARFVGLVPPDAVPTYLAAADIICIPNSGTTEISAKFTSPLKVFEALAAGRAIVASDLPSLREVLATDCAALVASDDPDALRQALISLANDPERRARLGEAARGRADHFDWRTRAEGILRFCTAPS